MKILWKWSIFEEISIKHYKNNDEYDSDDNDYSYDGDDHGYEEDDDNKGYRICEAELNRIVKRCDISC